VRKFDLLVDSSCDLPLDIVEEFGINMVPMTFNLGGKDYTEDYWGSISPNEFYTRIKSGEKSSTTLLTREKCREIFSNCAEKGRDVLFICLSGKLSGTFDNAVGGAVDTMEAFPKCRVRVVDSMLATMGHGLLALSAATKGDSGLSVDEVADYLDEAKHRHYAFFTVDDLMFLHAGGRLSKFSAIAGSLLGVKPVLWMDPDGYLKLRDKTRGRKASLEWLVDCMGKCVKAGEKLNFVTIAHGNCAEDGEYVKELISKRFNVDKIILTMLGAVIGSHSGPGTLALFFEGGITRSEFEKV
jgi:DegV family protein with EDD domain